MQKVVKELIDKWNFMMDYCKVNHFNPADSYYWSLAEIAWSKYLDRLENENE